MPTNLAEIDLNSLSSSISESSVSQLQDEDSLEGIALSLTETTKYLLNIQRLAPEELKTCESLRNALRKLSKISITIEAEAEAKDKEDMIKILQKCLSEKEETIRHIQHNHEETIRRLSQAHEETIRIMCERRETANSQMFAAAFSSREK